MTGSTEENFLKSRPQLGAARTDASPLSKDMENLSLLKRRQHYMGANLLFFHDPIHIVRGEGVWLFDNKGNKYLDCYNNVASVGHCHPDVVSALHKQAATLNTHTRYLHESAIDYAMELTDLMPDGLDVCMFTCTGTEANELATRIARMMSGHNGLIVIKNSYHGNSTLMTEASTVFYAEDKWPSHIEAVEPPNLYSGAHREIEAYSKDIDQAIARLEGSGEGVAAFLCDTIFDTQGTLEAPKDYFKSVYENIRKAGGLCIADEVQAGLCRTGRWWGFEHYAVVPDIVTLGKPMGDGHPIGIVVTSRDIAQAFSKSAIYFNTFGGNPVSMEVGRAVLKICKDRNLPAHCKEVGQYLQNQLKNLARKHPIIGNIRGHGLFLGVELVHDNDPEKPAADIAKQIPDAMKTEGVLIGITGRRGNVIKIRPPLIFSKSNSDQLITTLDDVLNELT